MKKVKIVSIIGVFLISFLCHFLYDIFPNYIFSIFFPVNESIWEHMKIIVSSILFYSPIEYFIWKKKKIEVDNFLLSNIMMGICAIIIYLIIFLPIYNMIGENMIINISLLLLVYIIVEIIGYYLLKAPKIPFQKAIAIIIITLTFLIFWYLTYFPIKNKLFIDITKNQYGIIKKEP